MDFSQDKTFPVGRTFVKHFLSDSRSGTKSNRTKFYVSYDEENLYFRFDCREEFFRPVHKEFNAPLYEGDIVELMLTLGEKNKYLEVEVNQNNALYLALITNSDGKGDISIKLFGENFIKSAISVNQTGWTCDIIIPIEKLTEKGWEAENAFFNAHRQDFDEKGYLNLYSLNPPLSDTFHVTDAFLQMKFN